MKSLHDIFSNGCVSFKEKVENGDTIKFYAFNGYHPIIKRLIDEEVHLPGTQGCFSQMFIEKGKAKAVVVLENDKNVIESVCFVSQNSWIIGNGIPAGNEYIGNVGYYTHNRFRGKGHAHTLSRKLEENLNKIVPDLKNRIGHIQNHVYFNLRKNFKILQIHNMAYGENYIDFFDRKGLKNPYSVNLEKEQRKIEKDMMWW